VRADSDWKIAAWEHLASGLQLGTNEIFDDPVDALRVAQSLEARNRGRGHGYRHPIWPLVVLRARRWQLNLTRYAYDEEGLEASTPSVGAHFTLLRVNSPRTLSYSVRATGETPTFAALKAGAGAGFAGRFRAALAKAWLDLGLAA
jgi:hypothetical protein